jgi:hypothetical protein
MSEDFDACIAAGGGADECFFETPSTLNITFSYARA